MIDELILNKDGAMITMGQFYGDCLEKVEDILDLDARPEDIINKIKETLKEERHGIKRLY